MTIKTIIGVLICCLIAVVGLFLYSDHQLQTEQTVEIEAGNAINTSTANTESDIESAEPSPAQPDKSLPIPAHQLKKLIANKPSSIELDEKIKSVNKSIEMLDAELEKLMPQSVEVVASDDTSDINEKNKEIKKRIENIRNHLTKKETLE